MRVLHVTPTHFDPASIVGGGERYVWELAKAMTAHADTTFFALADRTSETRDGALRVVHAAGKQILDNPLSRNPLGRQLWRAIARADVVHCFQVQTFLTSAALLIAKMLRRRVFLTDLGGGHPYAPSQYVPLLPRADAFLLISEYSRKLCAQHAPRARPSRLEVVYAGVDTERFSPGHESGRAEVLFVGRLVPHKGVEHLIDAVEPPLTLRIVGRPYDQAYAAMLRRRAEGRPVVFEEDVDDRGLLARYRDAMTVVLPSVSTDWQGRTTAIAELFGLAAAEAMSCGRPVIVSDTGSLPEVVEHGVSGFVVPAGDTVAIRQRLLELRNDRASAAAMGRAARQRVLDRFTWARTARRCVDAYQRDWSAA